ncbi:MAG: OPT/YSL family transporter [Anaerovoracaceae bacterium]
MGLGVYLPFYLSATAAVGGAIRFVADKLAPKFEAEGRGTIIASGLLGGESIVGVVIAMYYAYQIIS